MLLRINPLNPRPTDIHYIAEQLRQGAVIIYPTDTVYGIGCAINQPKAIERVAKIKNINVEKANFTFIFSDLSHLSDYTKPINNTIFKLLKKSFPGAFTFILEANNSIPKLFHNNKKTIGIRIPDNKILLEIVKELGLPLINASVHDDDDEIAEYFSDPQDILQKFGKQVDIVIDGGYGNLIPSTVIDCTEDEIKIVRQGLGEIEI